MCPVPRQHLVPEPVAERNSRASTSAGHESLEQVVVAAIALAPRKTEHAGDGVRLEHGRTVFVGTPNQSVVGPRSRLEIEGRERPVGADALEHSSGHLGVLGDTDCTRAGSRCHGTRGSRRIGTNERPLLYASKILRRS